MNIIGPDTLTFAVADMEQATQYLTDYGLVPVPGAARRFEALDGTGIEIVAEDDAAYPATLGTDNRLRCTSYGVADQAALDAVTAELEKDRAVTRLADGGIEVQDDLGFVLRFALTCRRHAETAAERSNAERAVNEMGFTDDFVPVPRTLSHFALFVPDVEIAEGFYARLGFRVTDRLGGGPFMRPAGTNEHHTLFLIKTPPHMKGMEHLAFHVSGPGEMMRAGDRFSKLGYDSFWGPGRHKMGSNWFWYFRSPLGCNVEYDADLDQVDDGWVARAMPFHPDNAQAFLFQQRETWVPGGPPPGAAPAGAH